MDVVNFDALKAYNKIITPSDIDPEEDYFIIGKYTNHYTTNSMKATKYPIYAIKAGDVMGDNLAVQSVTGLNTNNADPLNPVVRISVDGVTITGSGTPADPLVSVPTTSPRYLGEPYLGGIIYYLYKGSDGLEHGLVVSLTESTLISWQTAATVTGANRTEDGVYNTNIMTNSPAKTWVQSLGSGWYLPSIDELGLLYYNRYSAQKALRAGGHTLLSINNQYWSSNETGLNFALYFSFNYGNVYDDGKVNPNTVRAIKSF